MAIINLFWWFNELHNGSSVLTKLMGHSLLVLKNMYVSVKSITSKHLTASVDRSLRNMIDW